MRMYPKCGGRAVCAHPDFLEALLDGTNLVAYLKDIEGRYLYINRRYEVLSTVPRAALLGKRDHDFFPAEVADLFRRQDRDVAARRTGAEFEETIPLPGGVYSFITEKFPLFDKKGKVYAVGGICIEVTSQRNRADESLAAERERLAVTLRSITDGVVGTDANGAVIYLNPAAEALSGLTQAGAGGRTVDAILPAATASGKRVLGRLVREAMAQAGVPASARDIEIVSADGKKRTVVPGAAAVRDRGGKIIGAVLSLHDVTEQRRSEEELFKTRSLESLGFLAGGIAHDFNNFMTAIIGNLHLMEDELSDSDSTREMMMDAMQACRKAQALSRQLLTFASGGVPVRKTFALGPLLKETARLILRGSRVRSRVGVPKGLWLINGDKSQFLQILENLLVNAREAMPKGGLVTLKAENHALPAALSHLPAGRYVRLTVSDDGPGIAASSLARIFNPYFSTKARGSGLGLAIVHSVLRRHGGHIQVESTEGKGTEFTLLLPAGR